MHQNMYLVDLSDTIIYHHRTILQANRKIGDRNLKRVGVIGLGDMGSGLAKNLIEAGFETAGFDLSEERMAAFTALGGKAAARARAR